jgi:hypothetical protein
MTTGVRGPSLSGVRLLHTSASTLGKILDGLPIKVGAADRIEAKVAELGQKGAR